jgi:ABC-2 type transport system ATP-binding protein
LGQDISDYAIKKKIGYLPENHRFPQFLTGEQVLQFFGGFSDMPKKKLDSRIEYLLELTNMKDRRKSKIKTYSKGMIQRIGIAQALVNDPDVVFLDEPTDGVDPVGRKEIRDMLLTLKEQGKTIFLNSHLLSEVELIADQVVIINKGKIVKQGTVKELTHTEEGYKISYSGELDNEFFTRDAIANKISDRKAGSFILKAENQDELNSIIDTIRAQGILVGGIEEIKISLEDSFMALMNGNAGEQK